MEKKQKKNKFRRNLSATIAAALFLNGLNYIPYFPPVSEYLNRQECKKYDWINNFPQEERKNIVIQEYYKSPMSFWGAKILGKQFNNGKGLFVEGVLKGIKKCP